MIWATLWLLISVSDAAYNRGTLTVVERFADKRECEKTLSAIKPIGSDLRLACVPASTGKVQ